MTWSTAKVIEMLDRFEQVLGSRYSRSVSKAVVFDRVRVLKEEGYCDDVAFAIALKEHGF